MVEYDKIDDDGEILSLTVAVFISDIDKDKVEDNIGFTISKHLGGKDAEIGTGASVISQGLVEAFDGEHQMTLYVDESEPVW